MDQGEALKGLVAGIPSATLAAKLRPVMPEIDRRVREGVRHDEIVATLNANGVALSLNTFRTYLYRWRKTAGLAVVSPVELTGSAGHAITKPPVMAPRPRAVPPIRDRPDLDAVLDAARRDEIGETYLGRARPIFKPKGNRKP